MQAQQAVTCCTPCFAPAQPSLHTLSHCQLPHIHIECKHVWCCVLQAMQNQQPQMPNMPGFRPHGGPGGAPGGPGPRPMLPSDYKLAPPPTNAYQTDLALAAAANTMAPMPMASPLVPLLPYTSHCTNQKPIHSHAHNKD